MISKNGITVLELNKDTTNTYHDHEFPVKSIHWKLVLDSYVVVVYDNKCGTIKFIKNRYGTLTDIPVDVMETVMKMIQFDSDIKMRESDFEY